MSGPRHQGQGAASSSHSGQAPRPHAAAPSTDHALATGLGTTRGTTPGPDRQPQQAPPRPYYREGC
eukprot:2342383-Alexandrium_andersonii.AAC.1